ncbi:toll/interleukin-1 receptor domain-containing protein [Candidatus Colwellia aromaticivorans]|uniref:toll/interleukin-1 receptor domain-containing protein n=1 Tax=Candidatus Colwellia aromaticivorans TaxID=2267621 RepID=UPI000DF1C247|nr:toll/interleukin-1 receptor domain-containing protein [Candidatus Colwellia aromaticivorans]
MAYVSGFDQDIFISYAQVDNEPLDYCGREVRWVNYLKKQLQKRVDQKLGRISDCKIWMDLDDLAGNDAVTPTIKTAIDNTAALVIVLSDGYLKSEWCRKEIRGFVEAASADGRLFVIHLAEIPIENRPEDIRDLIGYSFYDRELKAELDPSSSEYSKELLKLRDKLAGKLAEMQNIRESGEDAESEDMISPAVFLAETTPDMEDSRSTLAMFIEKLGYRVLPSKLYLRGAQEFEQMLDHDLAHSKLFVQLLGAYGTPRTDEFPEGYEGLQLNRALAAKVPLLRAYERETFNLDKLKSEQRQFLEASDVMAQDLEELKVAIKDKLKDLALRESKPATADSGDKPVFIYTLKSDTSAAFHIRDRLVEQNLDYEIIVDEDESLEELASIRDYTGLVLVYGKCSSGVWIKQKMRTFRELRLAKQPIQPACVLYFEPPEKRNELLATPPPFFHTIDSTSNEIEFEQFISELQQMDATS